MNVRRLFFAGTILFFVVGDISTTWYGLQLANVYEANHALLVYPSAPAMLVGKGVIIGWVHVSPRILGRDYRWIGYGILTVLGGTITLWNLAIISLA